MTDLFVPLIVDFASDDAVLELTINAEHVFVRSLAFSKRTQSDGRVTVGQLARECEKLDRSDVISAVDELVQVGLYDVDGTGFRIRSWLRHNPSRDAISAKKDAKRLAGVTGNHNRWHIGPSGSPKADCELCFPSVIAPATRTESHATRTVIAPATHTESLCDSVAGVIGNHDQLHIGPSGSPKADCELCFPSVIAPATRTESQCESVAIPKRREEKGREEKGRELTTQASCKTQEGPAEIEASEVGPEPTNDLERIIGGRITNPRNPQRLTAAIDYAARCHPRHKVLEIASNAIGRALGEQADDPIAYAMRLVTDYASEDPHPIPSPDSTAAFLADLAARPATPPPANLRDGLNNQTPNRRSNASETRSGISAHNPSTDAARGKLDPNPANLDHTHRQEIA